MKQNIEEQNRFEVRKIAENFCGYLLLMAIAVSLFEIFLRIFFSKSYDFIIDFSVWLTIWALLLIAGPLLSEGGHVSIDFIREKLHGIRRFLLELFVTLSVLAFGVFLSAGSIIHVYDLYVRGVVFPRYISIPMWAVQLCMPVGMIIFSIYAALIFFKTIAKKW
jgi:TRAP-type C4-dicarboxylate transport system permease small subunit